MKSIQPMLLRAWLLVLLLLAAQAAGLAHRIVHAPGLARGASTSPGVSEAQAAATSVAASASTGLREHLPSGAECRLLDALAHADGLSGEASVCTAVKASGASSSAPATVAAPRFGGAPYEARAPPLG